MTASTCAWWPCQRASMLKIKQTYGLHLRLGGRLAQLAVSAETWSACPMISACPVVFPALLFFFPREDSALFYVFAVSNEYGVKGAPTSAVHVMWVSVWCTTRRARQARRLHSSPSDELSLSRTLQDLDTTGQDLCDLLGYDVGGFVRTIR